METVSAFPDIPILDQHCHAGGYIQPDGSYRSVEQHERQYARGYLEDKISHDAYRRMVLDGCVDPGLQPTIDELFQVSFARRENVGFSRALRLGLRRLHGENLKESELRIKAAEGQHNISALYSRALDLANCEAVLSDVAALDRTAWPENRYKWIYRLDPYFYPFLPATPGSRGTEFEYFHARLQKIREAELERAGYTAPPDDFDEYVAFVYRVFERVVEEGAIGFKIVSAYIRSLAFDWVGREEAESLYRQRSHDNGIAVRLSSFFAREFVAFVADRFGLPIQVHVGIGHPEPGMDLQSVNPMHLQTLFDDPRTRGSSFIMLHGAYPYSSFASAVAQTYPNVYLDFSWMTYLQPEFLERQLVEWFEYLPEHKLMFGSDTGLPEIHVAAVELGTGALKRALEYGVARSLWTQSQAARLAERALRTNLADVYDL